MDEEEYLTLRRKMVDTQLKPRGIVDPAVLESMRTVPRHKFVPDALKAYSYEDGPLPIGEGQTISQPYIVALMAQAPKLNKDAIVLEIGTGSGYSAAVLSRCAAKIYTIERVASLAKKAEEVFKELNYTNIITYVGDGTLGWPGGLSFDAIIVTAGAPVVPENLAKQLKLGGRLIIPVGDTFSQELVSICKVSENKLSEEFLGGVRFVPLIGEEGWKE